MESWSLNKLQIQTYNANLVGDIIEKIKAPIQDREGFSFSDKNVILPRYFYRFIGTHASIDDYKKWLFELDSSLSKFNNLYLKITNGFEATIEQDFLIRLDNAWLKLVSVNGAASTQHNITAQQTVDILNSYHLIPDISNPLLLEQLKQNFKLLIEQYFELNNDNIDEMDFRNLIYYNCYWLTLYFDKLTIDFDYIGINPKILFYGNIKSYEVFFLVLMSTFGIDVLYINSALDGTFDIYNTNVTSSKKHELVRLMKNIPFPDSSDYTRIETFAKQAEEEVSEVLHSSDSGCYKPWQFKDYKLNVKTLSTSYSEIGVWLKNEALYRPGWDVDKNTVTLSNVFAKISGIHDKSKKYLAEVSDLSELPNTKFFSKCPFSSRRTDEIDKFESIVQYKNGKPYIDSNELVSAQWWPYRKLRQGIQNLLADKICYIINEGILTNSSLSDEKDVLVYTFSKLLHIDDWLIELLLDFDYPTSVPKVIVYNYVTNSSRGLTFFDSIMLLMANLTGMDVLLFTPSGYQDIENYINPDLHLYDVHILEDVDAKLEFKKGTFNFIKKLFS